jgi:hypothetical protein
METEQHRHHDNRRPFIKKFTHNGFFYIYDVNTNQIVEVEHPIFDIIEDFDEDNADGLTSKYKKIYTISVINNSISFGVRQD